MFKMATAKDRFTRQKQELAKLRRRRFRRIRHLVTAMLADVPAEIAAGRRTPDFQVCNITR
jgi:hypothetical protein